MSSSSSPQGAIIQLIMGPWIAQALGAVARIGIADELRENAAKTSAELAGSLGVHSGALERTLRALSGVGLFTRDEQGRWRLTETGSALRSDVPGSMRYFAIAETDDIHWQAWGRFADALRSGEPQAANAVGCDPYTYYSKFPDKGHDFSRAMSSLSALSINAVLQAYDFSGIQRIADVGGAQGALLSAVLNKHSDMKGVLFDLPNVVETAPAELKDVEERVHFIGGDYFKDALPNDVDVYMLKHILESYDDEECVVLLRRIRQVMKKGSRILVIEMEIPDPIRNEPSIYLDLNMLVMLGGRERTIAEHTALFENAGLKLQRSVRTNSPYVIYQAGAAEEDTTTVRSS